MKRKITSRYLQYKEAYLDGFREGFSRAYHLEHKGEYHEGYDDGFSDAFRIALDIDKAFTKRQEQDEIYKTITINRDSIDDKTIREWEKIEKAIKRYESSL